MNIFFLLWKCLATLRMWHKWCFIGSQTICLILTMEIPNLHIFMREKRKSSFWKSSRWNARLIYTSNENNFKKKKKIGLDNQSFWKISSIGNNFIYYITKIFLLYTLNLRLSWMGIKSWQRTEVELQSFKSVKAGGNPFKKAKRELWEDSDKSFSVKIPNKIWSHCSCIAYLGSTTSFPDL